ncbi:MAG: antibiotic biosynthesis monooxygenase, partial [Acidimicrobiia bacterium]|nr:antibiotic biosynthesis monooxygenase [Acidimicrobiia bacterium]
MARYPRPLTHDLTALEETEVYGLIGKIRTAEGAAERLADILGGLGSMPGCISYVPALDAE